MAFTNGFITDDLQFEHYDKHVVRQREFPHISTEEQYVESADEFCGGPVGPNVLVHIRSYDGAELRYNTITNEFGMTNSSGCIVTYFKPSAGARYFHRNCR